MQPRPIELYALFLFLLASSSFGADTVSLGSLPAATNCLTLLQSIVGVNDNTKLRGGNIFVDPKSDTLEMLWTRDSGMNHIVRLSNFGGPWAESDNSQRIVAGRF